jgi:hypothetical protein
MLTFQINLKVGAGGGIRTPNPFQATDFKSVMNASSNTPAYMALRIGFEPMLLP